MDQLAQYSRTNVVMACGSGKTLVGMRIAETANRILMLEPSLALIRQALEEARQDGLLDGRMVICVCSDKTLGRKDHWKVTDEELGIPVTTDSASLSNLLAQSGERCVVFCTYQSQGLLRDSLPPGFQFDFGNFDEAHRTAGARGRAFSMALTDDQIPIGRRLFLTATPRLFIECEEEDGDTAHSMDDVVIYGRRAYELSLPEAIERGIVCDYQVLTACVSSSDVQDALKRANHLLLPQKKLPLELVAGQIAVVRAILAAGARRVITFHASIDAAEAFTRDRLKIYKQAGVVAFHIHGDMPGRQRQAVINAFLSAEGPSLLSNCHCLTEGVDVPEIDMVGIMCRKESVQEIVQAVGRALRNRAGKERGYVLLPLYVNEHEPIETALDRSDMAVTWEILHSVLESDGMLTNKSVQPTSVNSRVSDLPHILHRSSGKLRLVASEALFEDLQRAITVRHIHRLAARWDVMFAAAGRFAKREGSLVVSLDQFEDELPLGRWVERQRYLHKRGRLGLSRAEALTALGMIWNTREAKWAAGLKLAQAFFKVNGHLNVPSTEAELRFWLQSARMLAARQRGLPSAKLAELSSLGIELPMPGNFEKQLNALKNWREAHPTGQPGKGGPDRKLRFFLNYLRQRYREGKLDESVLERVAGIGFDVRNVAPKRLTGNQLYGEKSWDLHYHALKAYVAKHEWRHLWRTPEFNGLLIRGWVNYQRELMRKGLLTPERHGALTALGIHWNRKSDWWHQWADQLDAFKRDNGHLRLPSTENFARLRNQVLRFRNRLDKGNLPEGLVSRLNAINFPRSAEEELWQWSIVALQRWRDEQGPNAFIRRDLPKVLQYFLARTRKAHRREELSVDKIKELRNLGIPWAALDPIHIQMMARLTRLGRELGKVNTEAMASRESDLNDWLQAQLLAGARGELSDDAVEELRRAGIDIEERPTTLDATAAVNPETVNDLGRAAR